MKHGWFSVGLLAGAWWAVLPLHAEVVPGLFNTGVNTNGALLAPGAMDPHWQLVSSADTNAPGPSAFVVNNTGFPIPPWLAQGPDSQWIAPQPDQSLGNGAGSYCYHTTFPLDGFDFTTTMLRLVVASDNLVPDVRLNGVSTGLAFTNEFAQWRTNVLTSGFVPGLNTLELVVTNSDGPTGFRAEVSATATPLQLASRLDGTNVVLSWTSNLTCYVLTSTTNLAAPVWSTNASVATLANGRLTLTVPQTPGEPVRFYRLARRPAGPPVPVVRINQELGPVEESESEYARFAPQFNCGSGLDGCALLNQLRARNEHTFDAFETLDPAQCNPNDPSLTFRWEIRYPASFNGGAQYTARGISGYVARELRILPHSLPDIGTAFWRIRLTITSLATGQSREARFRFQYLDSTLTIQMSQNCQSPTPPNSGCPENALPPLPGTVTIVAPPEK